MKDPGDLIILCETPAEVWQAINAILPQLPEEQALPLKRLTNELHSRCVSAQKIAEDAAITLFRQVNNRSLAAILKDLAEKERRAMDSGALVTTYHYDGTGQLVGDNPSPPVVN